MSSWLMSSRVSYAKATESYSRYVFYSELVHHVRFINQNFTHYNETLDK